MLKPLLLQTQINSFFGGDLLVGHFQNDRMLYYRSNIIFQIESYRRNSIRG